MNVQRLQKKERKTFGHPEVAAATFEAVYYAVIENLQSKEAAVGKYGPDDQLLQVYNVRELKPKAPVTGHVWQRVGVSRRNFWTALDELPLLRKSRSHRGCN